MATRSTKVQLTNFTNQPLRRLRDELLHGIWTAHPPNKVEPLESAVYQSESYGFCTGREGWIEFEVGDGSGVMRLHWNNPFIGSNGYSHTAPPQ
jgi:hypothetical protein